MYAGTKLTQTVASVLLLSCTLVAQAEVIIYSDRSDFERDVPSPSILTFDGIAAPNQWVVLGTSWTSQGVTFADPANVYAVNDRLSPDAPGHGRQYLIGDGGDDLTISLPRYVTAVGMYCFVHVSAGATFTFSDSNQLTVHDLPIGIFLGAASTDPGVSVTGVVLQTTGYPDYNNSGIDDFAFGTYVPEPATLSLLALGGLAVIRRRWRINLGTP